MQSFLLALPRPAPPLPRAAEWGSGWTHKWGMSEFSNSNNHCCHFWRTHRSVPGLVPSLSLKCSIEVLPGHHVVGVIGSHFIVEESKAYRCWALLMAATSKRQGRIQARSLWLEPCFSRCTLLFQGSAVDICWAPPWARHCAKPWKDPGDSCHPHWALTSCKFPRSNWKGLDKTEYILRGLKITAWNWLGNFFLTLWYIIMQHYKAFGILLALCLQILLSLIVLFLWENAF